MASRAQIPNAAALVNEYIKKAPPFARPICNRLREIFFKAEPGIVEDWKWGPNYSKNGMVCGFGAFKQHVSLAFFRSALMKDQRGLFIKEAVAAKSMRRIKFTSLDDVDEPTLVAYIKEAVAINTSGIKSGDRDIPIPKDFRSVLAKSKKIKERFDSLSYTHKKEYVRWIKSAKKEETRKARLEKAFEMLKKKVKHP
ncbi:MAG: YdeI/OmpD-associated family protein [Bacteroidota bacterium]